MSRLSGDRLKTASPSLEDKMKNLYVGNMDASTTEDELKAAFGTYGLVEVVTIIKDRDTSVSRGFAFVEMATDKEAQEAVAGLNGSLIAGRTIVVNEARAKPGAAGQQAPR
jgi:RNA recognition motif-containing protein